MEEAETEAEAKTKAQKDDEELEEKNAEMDQLFAEDLAHQNELLKGERKKSKTPTRR